MNIQQQEVNLALNDVAKAMEGFSKGTTMALQVIVERLKALEEVHAKQEEANEKEASKTVDI